MPSASKVFQRGDRVLCNVGRGRGTVCTVIAALTNIVERPDGTLWKAVRYRVRTPNGNTITRGAEYVTPHNPKPKTKARKG